MKIEFIRSSEKRKIIKELDKQFGIKKVPHLLIKTGKDRIRGYSGSLSKEEIKSLSLLTNIESIGIYLFKKEKEFRMTIEASQIFSNQITKNIEKLTKSQITEWIKGKNIYKKVSPGTKIIQYQNDKIGCGISTGKKIINFIPKSRRLKAQNLF